MSAEPTRSHVTVNGIDWLVQPLDDGTGFVTYGRTPAVQVLVPGTYAPETFALPALAPAGSTAPPAAKTQPDALSISTGPLTSPLAE